MPVIIQRQPQVILWLDLQYLYSDSNTDCICCHKINTNTKETDINKSAINILCHFSILAATVESLFKELTKDLPLYQGWDELHTLTESWGIYRSGSGAYDKSFFNTLFSCPDMMRRQIKGMDKQNGEKGKKDNISSFYSFMLFIS